MALFTQPSLPGAFHRPHSLAEALALLAASDLQPVAGGTDVYPALTHGAGSRPLLDVSAIHDLPDGVSASADGWLIGARTTWSGLRATALPPLFDGLKAAADAIGGRQIQNRATLVGNVCNASPAADGATALLALDARVLLQGGAGQRAIPLADFITGNRRTLRRSDELVTGLSVPARSPSARSRFLKLGARRYLVISIAMVAVLLEAEEERVTHARVAVGACASRSLTLPAVESFLLGRSIRELIDWTGPVDDPLGALQPISDVRAEAAYRLDAARVLIGRAVAGCAREILGASS